jgi:hypothetical protein
MQVRYTLALKDHLTWYDYYLATPNGARFQSSLPLVAGVVNRFKRWKFSRQMTLPPSHHALGERTLEATEKELREFSPEFSFTTAWSEIGLMAITPSHLFLAHTSMNAHIVPLHFFKSDVERESFLSFAKAHLPANAV